MRLAVFCNDYWPTIGGVQTGIRGLSSALRDRGHEVMVLTYRVEGTAEAETVAGTPVRRFRWAAHPTWSFPLRALGVRRALRSLFKAWAPTGVYAHFVSTNALYAWDCASMGDLPLVLSFRGNDALRIARRSRTMRRVYSWLTGAANVNLFCSEWLRGEVAREKWFRGVPARTGVLADAVDVGNRAAVRPWPDPYVLAPGRLVFKKGFDLLIRAWRQVGPQLACPLLIAGDGEERAALEALTAELGLGAQVHFLGAVPHPELLGILEKASLCVIPSREEPYGIGIVEPQALGVPVVASAVGNIPHLVGHRRTGYLAEPTVAGLASVLLEAWNDPHRTEVGRAGREAPGARRSYQEMASELEGWFALAGRAGTASSWT